MLSYKNNEIISVNNVSGIHYKGNIVITSVKNCENVDFKVLVVQ